MLKLSGKVLHVLQAPRGINRETGEEYGGHHQVQLLVEKPLRNGEIRQDIVNLNVDDPEPYRKLVGREATVSVGAFASGNAVRFFLLKSAPSSVSPTSQAT